MGKRTLNHPSDLLKIVYKTAGFSLLITGYVLSTLTLKVLERERASKLKKLSRLASFFASLALRLMGVHVEVTGECDIEKIQPTLIVSNHLSYLDIFIISSLVPSLFIAGIDGVQENFLIGNVTWLSGSIFVERKTRARLSRDIRAISGIIPHNLNLVLFPEGTTTDGETVHPFKSSLFLPAAESGMDVTPLCIKYEKVNNSIVSNCNKDLVLFHGDMSFFPHLFRMMTLDRIEVRVQILETVKKDEYGNRKELRDITFERIRSCYEKN